MKKKGIRRWITAAVIALGAVTIISCTKMDEDCDSFINEVFKPFSEEERVEVVDYKGHLRRRDRQPGRHNINVDM